MFESLPLRHISIKTKRYDSSETLGTLHALFLGYFGISKLRVFNLATAARIEKSCLNAAHPIPNVDSTSQEISPPFFLFSLGS